MTAPLDDAVLDDALRAGIVARVADPEDYATFQARGRMCGWCSEPVRLIGTSKTLDAETGEIVESFSTDALRGRELLKPCGTRRATRCPSCAAVYKGDARQLVLAGLLGGKGVPSTVAGRPMVFATLTAPSFGFVHRYVASGGPCQARGPKRCAHGRRVSCLARHTALDPALGEPLCLDCYDHEGTVLFNAQVSELWRRTTIYTMRNLARLVGLSPRELHSRVHLSYVKVAEFQSRGVIHLHVLARLDSIDDEEPDGRFSAETLGLSLRIAKTQVRVLGIQGRQAVRWGEQFDCRAVTSATPDESVRIANYLAKYATKGSDDGGALDRRLRSIEDLDNRTLSPHLRELVSTAWRLGADPALARLRLHNWAHTLGLRSHFLTKARRFSTTFGALRQARRTHQRAQHLLRQSITVSESDNSFIEAGEWSYVGRGWRSRAERFLAHSEANAAIEARRLAADDDLASRCIAA